MKLHISEYSKWELVALVELTQHMTGLPNNAP